MFKGLCTPAQLYLVLSVLSVISVFIATTSFIHLAFSSAITLVWTYVLNKICQHGYTTLSWVFVLIPMLLLLVGLTLMIIGVGFLATAVKDGDLFVVLNELVQEKLARAEKAQTREIKQTA